MQKLLLLLVSICISFSNLYSQSDFVKKYESKDEYNSDQIFKLPDGNFIGITTSLPPAKRYYYLMNSKFKDIQRKSFDIDYGGYAEFYAGPDYGIMTYMHENSIKTFSYNYKENSFSKKKLEFGPISGYILTNVIKLKDKNLYYLNVFHAINSLKGYVHGKIMDVETETLTTEYKNNDNKQKYDKINGQQLFLLKNGNILHFVSENTGKKYVSRRSDQFSVYLYDKEFKLLSNKSFKTEHWYNCGDAHSLVSNSAEGDVVYLWARNSVTNKMSLFKISVSDNKIDIIENEIKKKDVENVYLDDKKIEGYESIFNFLISDMPFDKYQEEPGRSYFLDSSYVIGNETYLNYHAIQYVKGELKGRIYLSGVFVLNSDGVLTKNIAVDMHFIDEKRKNFLELTYTANLTPFYNGKKVNYAFVSGSTLKGFVVEEGNESFKVTDEVELDLPEIDKDKTVEGVFKIMPIDNSSFVLKAIHKKNYNDGGMSVYKKCDYKVFKIE